MYCERYKCKLNELSCLARRRNALEKWKPGHQKPGAGDMACRDCDQGKKVFKKHNEKEVEAYSQDLKRIRKKAFNNAVEAKRKGRIKAMSEEQKGFKPMTVGGVEVFGQGNGQADQEKACGNGYNANAKGNVLSQLEKMRADILDKLKKINIAIEAVEELVRGDD
jgi:hypothetical protein